MYPKTDWHRLYTILLLVFVATWCVPKSYGQTANFDIQHYSISEGLPHKHINSILCHSDGFIWIGTRNGLCRFDGYEFLQIPLPKRSAFTDGLVGPWVGRLQELKDGKILVSYLNYTDVLEYTDYTIDPTSGLEMTLDSMEKFDDSSFNIVNSTEYKGDTLVVKDQSNNEMLLFKQDDKILAFLRTNNDRTFNLSKAFEQASHVPVPQGKDFSQYFIFSVFNGLEKVNPIITKFKNYFNNTENTLAFGVRMRALLPIGEQKLIASSEASNIMLLNTLTSEYSTMQFLDIIDNKPLKTRFAQAVIYDQDSIVWAVTLFNGLHRLNLHTMTGDHIPIDSFYRVHHLVQLDDRSLVISGQGKNSLFVVARVNSSNPMEQEYIVHETSIGKAVANSFLLPSKNNHLWIGHSNGLYYFNLNTNEIIATYKYKNETRISSDDNNSVHFILNGKSVLALYEAEDQLLIGLEHGGLNILDLHNNTIEFIGKNEGLLSESVAGIVRDETGYWLSTYNGLYHLDVKTGHINSFHTRNGLPHNEFNRFSATKGPGGQLFFGGMNGLTSFKPQDVLHDRQVTKIKLCEVKYYRADKQIVEFFNLNEDKSYLIPAKKRACSFKFMLDDFTNSEANTFSYRLLSNNKWINDLESKWKQNHNNRTIQFDYLPSGSYELQVRGKASTGAVSDIVSIELNVQDYFYNTWWFITLAGLTVFGLIYGFYKMRLKQLMRIEKLRTKLSSDLHDDVGSLLSGIAYQMELLEYTVDEKRKPLVQKLALSSRKAMNQMRDVVWAIDSRNSTCQDLIERIRQFASDILEPLGIDHSFIVDKDATGMKIPGEHRHDLLLICKEFITNTVKHAKAKSVVLQVSKRDNGLLFELADDGIGMTLSTENPTGQGIKNMHMRAKKMNARIKMFNKKGFTLTLFLPKV